MEKYFSIDRVEKEAPFVNLAITTKEIDSKSIDDLSNAFTNGEFTLSNLTSNIQIHSDIVNIVGEENINSRRDGDALVTNLKNVPLLIFTADCTPIAFIDKNKKAIGLAHAGWRGTYAEIANKTIKAMHDNYNSNPEDILCIIGPTIGECCYEVSKDLYEKFDLKFGITSNTLGNRKGENYYLNLEEINNFSLKSADIKEENIIKMNICTNCNEDKFHSYRAHNKTNKRIGTLIELI